MRILVTGVAGFIGMHVTLRMLSDGHEVAGLDNLNDYYDVNLKQARLDHIGSPNHFTFRKLDLTDRDGINTLFDEFRPEIVINLAAQAGVRYSLENPHSYIDSNIVGFMNILECCKNHSVKHLLYASSSSVYGGNDKLPYKTQDFVDNPVSIYAASKKSNELMAHVYSHLFGLKTTGLRFFTVYGPWGRPDMALFKFTEAILRGEEIQIFNNGNHSRDFTFIDDIVQGMLLILYDVQKLPRLDRKITEGVISPNYQIYNIGNNKPVKLLEMVEVLEKALAKKANKKFLPKQPGDVSDTWADIAGLEHDFGFTPRVAFSQGVERFVNWYRSYHKV